MIEFPDPTTYPEEILNIPQILFDQAKEELEVRDQCILLPSDLFNSSPKTPTYDELHNHFKKILYNKEVKAYHATRLIDPSTILKYGLHRLDFDRYLYDAETQLKPLIPSDIYRMIHSAILQYMDVAHRAGQVCAFCNKQDLLKSDGYWHFASHWGGEVLRNAMGGDNQIPSILRHIGVPSLISFIFTVSDIEVNNISYRLSEFIKDVLDSELRRRTHADLMSPSFCINFKIDIPAARILEIEELRYNCQTRPS